MREITEKYLRKIRVTKLRKTADGRPLANCFVIGYPAEFSKYEYDEALYSYGSLILLRDSEGKITLNQSTKNGRRLFDYSTTTSTQRNVYLGIDNKQFKENMKKGIYQIRNL